MIIAPNEFIPELDFTGLLKLEKQQYIRAENNLSFNHLWTLIDDTSAAHLIIRGFYYKISKKDFKNLVSYTAEKDHFVNFESLDNEEQEIKKCFSLFCKDFADEFNNKVAATKKIELTFPQVLQSNAAAFCQRLISDLHNKIQKRDSPL